MADFSELRLHSDFVKLNSNRIAIFHCMGTLKGSINSLSTAKPSLRSFTKLETAIVEETKNLKAIDKKISAWFIANDGKTLDSDFEAFRNESVKVLSELEEAQNAYHDLLQAADCLPVQVKPEISADSPVANKGF